MWWKQPGLVGLIVVLLVASVFRVYKLGSNPISLDWDEVSLGYNAYSLLKTGNDEYGNSWPLSIRSFNDYKPPLYTYLTIPFVAGMGLSEVAVRLPSALSGIVAVGFLYGISHLLFKKHKHVTQISLFSGLLLAISPWHLQFSRAAFEANVAFTTYLGTIYFFMLWRESTWKYRISFIVLSALSAGATMYAYHSARLILPVLLVIIGWKSLKSLIKDWKQFSVALALGLIVLAPFVYVTFFRASSLARFNTVSYLANRGEFSSESGMFMRNAEFFNQGGLSKVFHHRYVVIARIFARNYLDHFNLDFLFLEGDGNGRHRAWGMGLLYWFELPLILYGIYHLVGNKKTDTTWLIWAMIAVAPVASALTDSTPHAIRGFLLLPPLVLLSAFGGVNLILFLKTRSGVIRMSGYLLSSLFLLISFGYYINAYYVVSPYYYAKDWQYGYKELVQTLSKYEAQYDEIIVTNYYDQPHIYFAFYNKIDPSEYQSFAENASSQIGKYHFRRIETSSDMEIENALVVVDPERIPSGIEPVEQIFFPNGKLAFSIFESQK